MLQLMDKIKLTFLRSEFFFRPKKSLVSGNVSMFLRHWYEGRSICNENSPVYSNILYLHAL